MLKKRHLFQWLESNRSSRRLLLAILLGALTVVSLISDYWGLSNDKALIASHHTARFHKLIPGGIAISLNMLQNNPQVWPTARHVDFGRLLGPIWRRLGFVRRSRTESSGFAIGCPDSRLSCRPNGIGRSGRRYSPRLYQRG